MRAHAAAQAEVYPATSATIHVGDALGVLRTFESESVHSIVTSPPYWRLRDYGIEGQIGLEELHTEYVEKLVAVFEEARRVLRADGTFWINLGDSYAGNAGGFQGKNGDRATRTFTARIAVNKRGDGLKTKDLVGIPWAVAFALRSAGWWLRQEIIWGKRNPMLESVKDRPSRAHEQMFLLTKSPQYFYDAHALRTPLSQKTHATFGAKTGASKPELDEKGAQLRSLWLLASEPSTEKHFAVMPKKLVEPCILAGCPKGGVVLDPFAGAGTVGIVALRHERSFIGIELHPTYAAIAARRIRDDAPMFNQVHFA